MLIFIVLELALGQLVADFVVGKYKSMHLAFLLKGLLNLASYFLGGLIVGLISPGIRLLEPALGAFLSLALMLSITFFTPYSFLHFSMSKLVIGGIIAFFLAITGAKIGEQLSGNRL